MRIYKFIIVLLAVMLLLTSCSDKVEADIDVDVSDNTTIKTIANQKTVEASTDTSNIVEKDGVTYVNGILIANKTYGLPSTYAPGVNQTALDAFSELQKDATEVGLSIYIISDYRSYSRQETLYNNYAQRDGKDEADRYSARPGHSEHQTGLAFDVNSLSEDFEDTAEGKWLAENCYKYGFIIRYPKGKEDITGYMYEPWHIRYLGIETATKVYQSGKTLEEYLGITSEYSD